MENVFSVRGVAFLALFTALAFIGMQINFSQLVGAQNQFFTLFQFYGPIAGGFLGVYGAFVVFAAQAVNLAISGKSIEMLSLIRLLPMVFAAFFFSQYKRMKLDDKLSIAIPVIAMVSFWLTPAGLGAWYYALFWTIPVIVKFLPDRLFLRSLGATFTAHAVGGALWAWTVPMTSAQWAMLVPVTATERLLFAAGIAISYVFFTNVLNAVDKAFDISKYVNVERQYVLHF
ncbi:MAG: hypothetical protein V1861_05890 [Candidatus Micrarchaeota archaeon]